MRTFSTIVVILIVLVFSSCSNKAKDLEGRWRVSTKPLSRFNYYWDFQAVDNKTGNIAILTEDTISLVIDTCSSGDFRIKNSVLTVGAPVQFCEWHTFDGEWDVHKLNKKFLTLIRYLPRGTIYIELIKE